MIYNDFQQEMEASLRDFELTLKKLYLCHPSRMLDQPHALDEVKDLLELSGDSFQKTCTRLLEGRQLKEDAFFHHGTDVELYQHLRYLPASWHSHDFIEIAYLIQGSCTNYILEEQMLMQPGDVCIIAPGTRHAVSAFSDECLLYNILLRTSTFETAFFGVLQENDILSDFFKQTLFCSQQSPYLYFGTGSDHELLNYMGYAYQEFHRNRQYKNRMMASIIHAFFITLLRNHGANVIFPKAEAAIKNENTILILKYMQEHYQTLTLTELSSFFNYSERQIQRVIKASTGMGFRENIQKLKLKQAARLLLHTDRPVAWIAEELGYAAPSNFRLSFKKYYGMTPAEYRRKKRGQ
ncbi:MAG: AraC family transcriptional regulator [Eubacterium sp.]|nr:AraC family transcriptional regulator [Eubacterium sp.]